MLERRLPFDSAEMSQNKHLQPPAAGFGGVPPPYQPGRPPLDLYEVASQLRVSPNAIRSAALSGELRYRTREKKFWFEPDAINEYLLKVRCEGRVY